MRTDTAAASGKLRKKDADIGGTKTGQRKELTHLDQLDSIHAVQRVDVIKPFDLDAWQKKRD